MKALYRKYRPKTLAEVVGQAQVTDVLKKSLEQGKINHAYLFVGPRGCGKTSVARIFAHEVNNFEYQLEDDYVDIIEIDGASNRGIDNIRELREKAAIAPTSGKYKIYIIDEVHMLTKEAFNALLKTLEEPPKHVIFIMATTDAYKVPVTITSRAQTYTFKLADLNTMFSFLKSVCEKEKIKISDDALKIVAKRGGGSFRDSLSLLDQVSTLSDKEITKDIVVSAFGLPEDEKINNLINNYINADLNGVSDTLKDLLSSGVKPETIAEEIIRIIVESPKPELLKLLSKLPEIKAPFADAKLLVALMPERVGVALKSDEGAFRSAAARSPLGTRERSEELAPAAHGDGPAGRGPKADISDRTPAQASEPAKAFNWNDFAEKVKNLNDAVYMQLSKTTYEFKDNELHIYPSKNIVKTILSRDNNKQILIDAAGGVKITIHDVGEKPKNATKNETLAKISDIMGGEVINDGGGNPF
ncbi:DNA polymerase III subunit gamma/tau [Candidatus Saccharibacteria bacterium]|nr:DNA polymerase III subunit gamma/tau [Candidatus Saccharibacteria bacterium]